MDFPVFTRHGYYILFEFHSTPLDEMTLLRDFQYLANFRVRVKLTAKLHIISSEREKKSVRKVAIMPDWDFAPDFTFLIDLDGDEILKSIKYKLQHEISLDDMDAYLLAVLPFTSHEMEMVEFVVYLIYFINEIELSQVHKYIIKLSQILWVNALIKDEDLINELMDVIKMRSTFIQNYERNLVESKTRDIAVVLKENNVSRDVILKATGIDIDKI